MVGLNNILCMCILGTTDHCAVDKGEYVAVVKGLEPLLALTWGLSCPDITATAVTGEFLAFHGREPGDGLAKRESAGARHQEECKMKQVLCHTPKL